MDVTVAIPNGDLGKLTGDQGYVDWVIGQLQKHRRIINLVKYLPLFGSSYKSSGALGAGAQN